MRFSFIALLALAVAMIAGCAGRQASSPIPDTEEAREILGVIESYRSAMEARDVDAILAIASRDYLDRMGTPDPDDDIYFIDLEDKLAADFDQVRRIRLDIQVIGIELHEEATEGDGPLASVRYRYDVRYQLSMPSGEKWHNALDINEMLLRRERDGAWRVLSGL